MPLEPPRGATGLGRTLSARERLVYPLDYSSRQEAWTAASLVAPSVGVLKIGLELFTRTGPDFVVQCSDLARDVFLDLKLCDIPQTVEGAVAAAAAIGVRYLTVHASGGSAMLERAGSVAAKAPKPLTLLAVTVLTSLDARDLERQGIGGSPEEHVVRLAKLAREAGIHGFVCSAAEARALRRELGGDVLIVTPGIRPASSPSADQKRVATPATAIADGADLLVVGRPIRDAADPVAAARAIVEEIAAAERASAASGAPWRG